MRRMGIVGNIPRLEIVGVMTTEIRSGDTFPDIQPIIDEIYRGVDG